MNKETIIGNAINSIYARLEEVHEVSAFEFDYNVNKTKTQIILKLFIEINKDTDMSEIQDLIDAINRILDNAYEESVAGDDDIDYHYLQEDTDTSITIDLTFDK